MLGEVGHEVELHERGRREVDVKIGAYIQTRILELC